VDDQDAHRWKDARVTTNFDRTKYNYFSYFFATHYFAVVRRYKSTYIHPDDPRVSIYSL